MPPPVGLFLPGSKESGSPVSSETRFRLLVPPHCGQSPAVATAADKSMHEIIQIPGIARFAIFLFLFGPDELERPKIPDLTSPANCCQHIVATLWCRWRIRNGNQPLKRPFVGFRENPEPAQASILRGYGPAYWSGAQTVVAQHIRSGFRRCDRYRSSSEAASWTVGSVRGGGPLCPRSPCLPPACPPTPVRLDYGSIVFRPTEASFPSARRTMGRFPS